MCFFIYSPDHNLSLIYASEKILPKKQRVGWRYNGTSDIEVDLVVRNDGPRDPAISSQGEKIQKLILIYPNSLFRYDFENSRADIKQDVIIEDITIKSITSFFDQKEKKSKASEEENSRNILDNILKKQAYFFSKTFSNSYIDEIKINHEKTDPNRDYYEIDLQIPDTNTLKKNPLQVVVHGTTNIDLFNIEESNPTLKNAYFYYFLLPQGVTFLEIKFDNPLNMGENRWVKLKIAPVSTSQTESKSIYRIFVEQIISRDIYSYEIKGPYNVLFELFNKWESYQQVLETIKEELVVPEDLERIEEFKRLLQNNIIPLTQDHIGSKENGEVNSRFLDWRLHVSSNRGFLTNIREFGIYKISGAFSNIIDRERTLTWKTGEHNVCPQKDEKIPLLCKPHNKVDCSGGPQGCYPFCGTFRISYDWIKDSFLFQFLIVALFIISIFAHSEWAWNVTNNLFSFLKKLLSF